MPAKQKRPPARNIPTCRECGCTEDRACLDDDYGACWWVEPDLCSHCALGLDCDHAGEAEAALIREMEAE